MLDYVTPEILSYIIGFLQGDGSYYIQNRNRGKITIELSSKDISILDWLESVFISCGVYVGRSHRNRNTNFKQNYNSCSLSIYDINTRSFLSQFIPSGPKSETIRPPISLINFDKYAYIRGLTDADGSLGITSDNRAFWSLCTSSEKIKKFVISDIKHTLGINKRLNRNKRDNVYNIIVYDENAIKYTQLLYNKYPMLERKFRKYQQLQSWIRTIPKRKGCKKSWLKWEDKIIMNTSLSIEEKCNILNRSVGSVKTRIWRIQNNVTKN